MTKSPSTHARRILVIDDEPDLRTLYELTLLREGYQVESAADIAEAWEQLNAQLFDLVITDMRLPDGLGVDLLKRLQAQQRTERCLVITAYGSAENAVESLKAGAFDYLTKPVDLKQFRAVVAAAIQAPARLLPHLDAGTADTAKQPSLNPMQRKGQAAIERIAGQSNTVQNLRQRILKVAPSMAPVMIQGESGTGKELVANALHANSHRANGPWVAVNCGAIPENLIEAEFFGFKKGAFTGASQDREGFFKTAHGGTLFLDEIGDLPLAMQAKLLRAIQERSIRPLGSNQEDPVDVRLISATHKNLQAEVAAGRFRQDLFYRLNVIDIQIAPLRERREDLPALCATLLARIAQEAGSPTAQLSTASLAELAQLPLLGNVRELENLLHRAVALGEESTHLVLENIPAYAPHSVVHTEPPLAPNPALAAFSNAPNTPYANPAPHAHHAHNLPSPQPTQTAPSPEKSAGTVENSAPLGTTGTTGQTITQTITQTIPNDLQQHLDQQERAILIQALQETGFNRSSAAKLLGLTLRQIRYRIDRLNIDIPNDSPH